VLATGSGGGGDVPLLDSSVGLMASFMALPVSTRGERVQPAKSSSATRKNFAPALAQQV
jgi:hypothetical protein